MSQGLENLEIEGVENTLNDKDSKDTGAGGLKPFFIMTMLFSIVVNILVLVSPLYMLQVYDRILTSGSVDTLITISVLAIALLMVYGVAEMARRKVVVLASDYLQTQFGHVLFYMDMREPDMEKALPKNLGYLSTLQNFFSHGLILPLFDLPFSPFFIVVMFLIHPLLGWVGVIGIIMLFTIAVISELTSRKAVQMASGAEQSAQKFALRLTQQQNAIVSMGMGEQVFQNWEQRKSFAGNLSMRSANRSGMFSSLTRSLRVMLQVAALGIGGWLVLQQQTSAGAIVAGSVLLGRALGPIDQSVGIWRQIIRAREAWAALNMRRQAYDKMMTDTSPMPRPAPHLSLEGMQVTCPGAEDALLPRFNLQLKSKTMLALVGRSGVGKTALMQTLAGAWRPLVGAVILGGRNLHNWDAQDRGRYIGYLPQEVSLLAGTVAQNICRFTNADIEEVVRVAEAVGCHEMILSLPNGYDTLIGPDKNEFTIHLSAGQKQTIGIARAVFGNPVVLFLDEPSAHLDMSGVETLKYLIETYKKRGGIVIVATHDMRLIHLSDNVITLAKTDVKLTTAEAFFKRRMPQNSKIVPQSSVSKISKKEA